jgi:Undecaprenyl-phosphate glucose phosphotransferase
MSLHVLRDQHGLAGVDRPVVAASENLSPPPHARYSSVMPSLAAIEFALVVITAYAVSLIYGRVIPGSWPSAEYILAALYIAALVLVTASAFHHFTIATMQRRHRFLWGGVGAVAFAFSFFLSTIFVFKLADDYSRGTFIFQWIGVTIAVLSIRAINHTRLQSAIARGVVQARRVILIGDRVYCGEVASRLKEAGIHTIVSFDFPNRAPQGPRLVDTQANGNGAELPELVEFARTHKPDDVLILAAPSQFEAVPPIADAFAAVPVALHIMPQGGAAFLASSCLAELGGVATIQVLHRPLSMLDQFTKRTFDLIVATLGLLVLSPLLVLAAVAIKIESRGPILFRQERHGYNNEPIFVLKFRTMLNREEGCEFTQTTRDDPRVTRVGRLLRPTNIDELPQLVNVVLGSMSIVGPRPHAVAHNELFEGRIAPYWRRHNVKPGITGWAQVNGYRGETDTLEKMQRRVECDLYYIDNWSFLFDVKIIVMTLFWKRAYLNAY